MDTTPTTPTAPTARQRLAFYASGDTARLGCCPHCRAVNPAAIFHGNAPEGRLLKAIARGTVKAVECGSCHARFTDLKYDGRVTFGAVVPAPTPTPSNGNKHP